MRRSSGTGWRHYFEASSVCLQLGAISRLGEDQNRRVASGEPGAVAVVRKALTTAEKATPSDAGSPGRGTHAAGTVWVATAGLRGCCFYGASVFGYPLFGGALVAGADPFLLTAERHQTLATRLTRCASAPTKMAIAINN